MAVDAETIKLEVDYQTTYLGEFRKYKRFLAAASLGQAAGYSLVNYVNNLFTPHLIDELGWTRSQIALVYAVTFLNILTLPLVGRLTDAFGVRRVVTVGVIVAPLVWFGLSVMTGHLWQFFLLGMVQLVVIGGLTGPIAYGRLIAQSFDRARGVAFAIAASAAPVAGVLSVPFLSNIIDTSGWRSGYVALAIGTAIVGLIALGIIPKHVDAVVSPGAGTAVPGPPKRWRQIIRNPAFRLIFTGVVLCNLSFTMQTAHLKVILLDNGVDSSTGSLAISLFASSVIIGRLLCGFALDRFPAYLVTAIALGLPGFGLVVLATGSSTTIVIALAVMLMGLALGAEGDVLAYVVRRYFKLEIFSTVLGLVLSGLALGIASGTLLLSLMLKLTNTYTLFMIVSSIAVFIGSATFLMLRRQPTVQ